MEFRRGERTFGWKAYFAEGDENNHSCFEIREYGKGRWEGQLYMNMKMGEYLCDDAGDGLAWEEKWINLGSAQSEEEAADIAGKALEKMCVKELKKAIAQGERHLRDLEKKLKEEKAMLKKMGYGPKE